MAVSFKLRSLATFDSVDIGGRPSISLCDLKSKIVHKRNLDVCQDFDLVFSDAATGQEYWDENVQISSGSSMIIKRVPVAFMHLYMAHDESLEHTPNKELNMVKTIAPLIILQDAEVNSFNDFGEELCLLPESTVSISGIDRDMMVYLSNGKTSTEALRSFEVPLIGCQKIEASDINDADPRGLLCHEETRAGPSDREHTKMRKVGIAGTGTMQNAGFPSQLKCYLCGSFFKEAVMIPCCQHSFCEKFNHLVLLEKQRCPKCSSTRCTVQDLLPNISVRQAINHFLESQNLLKSSACFNHYVSAKEMPCAVMIHQGKLDLPYSPSDSGSGSNQFIGEPVALCSRKPKHTDGDRGSEDGIADFQGENNLVNDEGNPMFREGLPGFPPPYWNGNLFPQVRHFGSPYGNPGLIPLNPTILPSPTFACAPYMLPAFCGMAAYGGFPRMGSVAAAVQNAVDWHMGHSEGWELRECVRGEVLSNGNMRRYLK